MPKPRKATTKNQENKKNPIAYFANLEIENFLCFTEKQCLNLSDENNIPYQWTVILGDNGVGKTTLLRCLAGMSMSTGEFRRRKEKENDFTKLHPLFSEWAGNPLFFEWVSLFEMIGSDATLTSQITFGCKLKNFKKNIDNSSLYSFMSIEVYGIEEYKEIEHDDFTGLICYGYGATRKIGEATLTDHLKQESYASLFSEKTSLINAEEWLLQADYSSTYLAGEKAEKISQKIDSIKKIFIQTLPDIEDFRFFLDPESGDPPTIQFKTPYGWVPFSDLGLGYKTMIVWMLDLIIRLYERYPDSEDPLSEPAIVLVDEIDLHLHPKWQRQIMSFLTERFPNTQFIVTAHSPLVVQASQDANIVLLRREGDRVVIDNNPEIIDNWRVDQILTSLFELPSARPATLDPYIEEREQILSKAHLTEEDRTRLDELREKIGSLPTGERPEDRKAMDIIRRAAKLIEEQNQQ